MTANSIQKLSHDDFVSLCYYEIYEKSIKKLSEQNKAKVKPYSNY